jgi:hypothetical protein
LQQRDPLRPPKSQRSALEPTGGDAMPTCETCGNEYDKALQIVLKGKTRVFDSFECAIQALAPRAKFAGRAFWIMGLRPMGTSIAAINAQTGTVSPTSLIVRNNTIRKRRLRCSFEKR